MEELGAIIERPKPYYMTFDGVNESITCPSSTVNNLTGNTPFSMACWFRSPNYSSAQTIFAKNAGGGTGWNISTTSTYIGMGIRGTSLDVSIKRANISLTPNVWYHVVCTSNGSGHPNGFNIYINGVLITNVSTPFTAFSTSMANASGVTVGSNASIFQFFLGDITMARYWKRELTAGDALIDYNSRNILQDAIYPNDLIYGFSGGQGGIFGTQWSFPNESTLDASNGQTSLNMEIGDRTEIIIQPFP